MKLSILYIVFLCIISIDSLSDIEQKMLIMDKEDGIYIYDFLSNSKIQLYNFSNTSEGVFSFERKKRSIEIIIGKMMNSQCEQFIKGKKYSIDLDTIKIELVSKINKCLVDSVYHIEEVFIDKQTGIDTLIYQEKQKTKDKFPFQIYSETRIVNGIQIVMQKGNLYIKNVDDQLDTFLLNKENYRIKSNKIPKGFLYPDLSHKGNKIIFLDYDKQICQSKNKKDKYNCLVEMDIKTREQKFIRIDYPVNSIKYSFKDRYILFYSKSNYFVYDLQSKRNFELPKADRIYWLYN
jgi:hypothetical protein